ncbi:MAG: winged helix-turn-helix transcriptional regulator [Peptococcaceae bacterium]|nr:winged helix-turn-helix transcriptional regulator [Peptococcaceae bacterium]
MEPVIVLKALADENRLQIVQLLLQHRHCVRALARKLSISEAAVSQHLKVLKDAELLFGERKGHHMHYEVNRDVLHELSQEIAALANMQQKECGEHTEQGCHCKQTCN